MANVLANGEILLFGTVGDAWYGDSFTATDVVMALAEVGTAEDVTVRINSGGGIATEGAAIYAALAAHGGTVTIQIEGIAASAASLIAMAGDDIVMMPGAVMMIHDPSGMTWGTAADHAKGKEALDALANAYAALYARQTGASAEAARNDMREELWLTGDDAVERGYADRTAADGTEAQPTAFDYRLYAHAPEKILAHTTQAAPAARKKPRFGMRSMFAGLLSRPQAKKEPKNPTDNPQTETEMSQEQIDKALADANARAKAILSAPEAKGREQLAQHLALSTTMSAEDAIATMKISPVASAGGAQRFDTSEMRHDVQADSDAQQEAALKDQAAIAASWKTVADKLNAQNGFTK